MSQAYRLRGTTLPDDEYREFWVRDGMLHSDPIPGAETLVDGGYLLPGLVDAHCHVGLGERGAVSLDEAADQAVADRDGGTLLIRDCGSPIDTSPLQQRADLPRIIRAGHHLARPKRYIRGVGVDLDDVAELPAAVAEQAAFGDGWVKLVGDWIDREGGFGDLAPLWPDDVLAEAMKVAHDHGARVTAHVFGEDAIPGLLAAGIDCLEHGTGLTDETIAEMATRGTALVPTLINVETFPDIAASAERYPRYQAHLRELYGRAEATIGSAVDAGIAVYAGTDAGGGIRHGRIVDEIVALHSVGMSAQAAIGAASWAAREWLGMPALGDGAPADVLVYDTDPRRDLEVLRRPSRMMLRGVPVR